MSYFHRVDNSPHAWETLIDCLRRQVKDQPDREAYVVRGLQQPREVITFSQLDKESSALAVQFNLLGLKKGDTVIITGPTCLQWFITEYALIKLGVQTLRMSAMLANREGMEHLVDAYNIKAFLYYAGMNNDYENVIQRNVPEIFEEENLNLSGQLSSLRYVICMGESNVAKMSTPNLLKREPTTEQLDEIENIISDLDPEDWVTMYMTSGSTGFPKAVASNHFMMVNVYRKVICTQFNSKNNIFFNDRSLTWIGSASFCNIIKGITCVFMNIPLSMSSASIHYSVQIVKEEKCTHGVFMPYLLHDMINYNKTAEDPLSIDTCLTGGECIPDDLLTEASKFCQSVNVLYGSTEIGIIVCWDLNDRLEERIGYVGRPGVSVEMKVTDNGKLVPMGETGELCFRSPYSFLGYVNTDSTGMAMAVSKTGWIRTGDVGSIESDGKVKVKGRLSQVIIRGCYKIYPAVVERFLLKHEDIGKVCVVGVPDPRLTQQVCAIIVPKPGAVISEDIMKAYADNNMATEEGMGYKPGYYLIMDQLPLVNGKMDRKALSQTAAEILKLK